MVPLGENMNSVAVLSNKQQVYSFAELLQQGRAMVQSGQYQNAKVFLEEALEQNSESFFVHFELGVLYHRWNELDRALSHFKTAYSLNNKDAKTLNNLGVIYYISQNYNHALESFLRAIKIDAKYVDAVYGVAKSFYALGKNQGALQYFKKCLLLDPKHSGAQKHISKLSQIVTPAKIRALNLGFVKLADQRG